MIPVSQHSTKRRLCVLFHENGALQKLRCFQLIGGLANIVCFSLEIVQISPRVSITPLLQCVETFKLALLRSCAQASGVSYAESLLP